MIKPVLVVYIEEGVNSTPPIKDIRELIVNTVDDEYHVIVVFDSKDTKIECLNVSDSNETTIEELQQKIMNQIS